MKNMSQPFMGGFPEQNERTDRIPTTGDRSREASAIGTIEDQILLDYLIEMGFVWEEAVKLLNLREHLYENAEMRQRLADDSRMLFARWLYEQGEMSE